MRRRFAKLARIRSEDKDLFVRTRRAVALLADRRQPAPDAMVTSDSADPAAIVAAHDGLRLALIASLQYLPPRQRALLVLRPKALAELEAGPLSAN